MQQIAAKETPHVRKTAMMKKRGGPTRRPHDGPLPFWPGPTKSKTCATKALFFAPATSTLPPIVMKVVNNCFQGPSVASETSKKPIHDVTHIHPGHPSILEAL